MSNEPIMPEEKKSDSPYVDMGPRDGEPSHLGVTIGILITLLAMVFIGLYIWGQMMASETIPTGPTIQRPTAAENNEPESTTAEARTEVLNVVSTSDELSAIEADLEATMMGDIESDISAIEAELGQ